MPPHIDTQTAWFALGALVGMIVTLVGLGIAFGAVAIDAVRRGPKP